MADLKITQLSAQASATNDDLLAIVNDPAGTPATNKITKAAFLAGVAPASRGVLAANAIVSSSALVTVTGLSAVVSAGGVYRLNAMVMVNRAAGATPTRYGLYFPTMNSMRGTIYAPLSVAQAGLATAAGARAVFGEAASGSIILSTASQGLLSTFASYDAIMNVNTGGSIKIMHGAAAGTSAHTILAGSYIEVIKLN